jgi:phage terminase large subunit-like protein
MSTKVGQNMNIDERNEYLRPFILTSILKQQMLNLVEENEGINIILKQSHRSVKTDKFSAFIYGLYYIRYEEELNKKKKKKNIADFLFFTPA